MPHGLSNLSESHGCLPNNQYSPTRLDTSHETSLTTYLDPLSGWLYNGHPLYNL